jgi:hypothetical protein
VTLHIKSHLKEASFKKSRDFRIATSKSEHGMPLELLLSNIFSFQDYFALQVQIGDTWIGDHVICLNNERPPTMFTSVHLATEASTSICIPTDDGGVLRLILTSANENNLRTLVLTSAFVVSNHIVDLSLQCWALCLPKNEKKVTPHLKLSTAKSECVYRLDPNVKGDKKWA